MGFFDAWADWWDRATGATPARRAPARRAPAGREIRDPDTGDVVGRVGAGGEIELDVEGEREPRRADMSEGAFEWGSRAAAFAAAIYASGKMGGWKGYALGVGVGLGAMLALGVLKAAVMAPATATAAPAAAGGERREP